MTNRLQGNHSHVAEAIIGLEDLIAAVGGVIIHDATSETDGVEDTFATPNEFASGKVRVFQNGLLLRPGVDFTEAGTLDAVLLTTPPAAGDELIIIYGTDGDTPLAFTQLVDTPGAYGAQGEKIVAVKADETGLEFIDAPSGGSNEGGFPNLRPASPNAMDDEFDDSSGSSGPVNGLDGKWALRGGNAPTITYPAPSWAHFQTAVGMFGYEQARPAAQNYTVVSRWSMSGQVGSANSFGGLYMIDSVNGDLYAFYYVIGNNNSRLGDLEVSVWGNSGTFFGGTFTALKQLANTPFPKNLRLVYTHSSTGIDFEASYDGGLTWANIWSVGSDARAHTHVGFFKTHGAGLKGGLALDWFRRTV